VSVFSEFDSQVSIYSGACAYLECVFTNDDSPIPGPKSIISEFLNEGQQVSPTVTHVFEDGVHGSQLFPLLVS
jgi:hypothetical protein